MKKTKIICTMGPNTNDKTLMTNLALNGMNIARFNFSHGSYEEHKGRLDLLKEVRKELGIPIAALLDKEQKAEKEPVGTELKGGPKDSAVRDEKHTHHRHVKYT